MAAEPRPCPGCGPASSVEVQRDAWVGRRFCVVCTSCYDGAPESRPFVAWGDTEAEAVNEWDQHVAAEMSPDEHGADDSREQLLWPVRSRNDFEP